MKTNPLPTDLTPRFDSLHAGNAAPFQIRTILVPTDFGPRHLKTIWIAAQIAEKWGAELNLLHVYHNPVSTSCVRPAQGTYHCEEYRSAKVSALQELCRQVREYYPHCEGYFAEGYPPDEIARYARHLHVDLLILSQNLHVPPMFTLSETPAIVREAGIPALILPN